MRYFCGIDIGASAAKLVILDDECQVVAKTIRNSGVDYAGTAQQCLDEALDEAGLSQEQVTGSLSTGDGRDNLPWAPEKMNELACHGTFQPSS